MKKIFVLIFIGTVFANDFLIGVGGYENIYFKNKRYFITDFLKSNLKNTNSFSIWVTKNWKENWYLPTEINTAIKKGYLPVFIFYWFEDDISIEHVKKNRDKYFYTLKKFSNFLKNINGQKIVILNPEFNQNDIYKFKNFNKILIDSIKILKENRNILVGFCLGDFGDYDLIKDDKNWIFYEKSYIKAVKYADFIAFQEMRALTKNSKKQILNTPLRAHAFAKFLYKRYKKPTFLAYLAISSYGEDGSYIQKKVLNDFKNILAKMKIEANLIGFNYFHLVDQPDHIGYFKEGEKYFGLIDRYGNPKPGFYIFEKIR